MPKVIIINVHKTFATKMLNTALFMIVKKTRNNMNVQ